MWTAAAGLAEEESPSAERKSQGALPYLLLSSAAASALHRALTAGALCAERLQSRALRQSSAAPVWCPLLSSCKSTWMRDGSFLYVFRAV